MKEALIKAIEGGYISRDHQRAWNVAREYGRDISTEMYHRYCYSDPLFWSSLGKSLGWPEHNHLRRSYESNSWRGKWFLFIDVLADGEDVDEFFNKLLS